MFFDFFKSDLSWKRLVSMDSNGHENLEKMVENTRGLEGEGGGEWEPVKAEDRDQR